MAGVKGRVDGSATIDIIAEEHITLGDIEENYFCGIGSAPLYKTVNVRLPLLTMSDRYQFW